MDDLLDHPQLARGWVDIDQKRPGEAGHGDQDLPRGEAGQASPERVIHHADLINLQGDSYRAREAQQNAQDRAQRRASKKK